MIFSGKTGKGKSYQWVDPMLGKEKEKVFVHGIAGHCSLFVAT